MAQNLPGGRPTLTLLTKNFWKIRVLFFTAPDSLTLTLASGLCEDQRDT